MQVARAVSLGWLWGFLLRLGPGALCLQQKLVQACSNVVRWHLSCLLEEVATVCGSEIKGTRDLC